MVISKSWISENKPYFKSRYSRIKAQKISMLKIVSINRARYEKAIKTIHFRRLIKMKSYIFMNANNVVKFIIY